MGSLLKKNIDKEGGRFPLIMGSLLKKNIDKEGGRGNHWFPLKRTWRNAFTIA